MEEEGQGRALGRTIQNKENKEVSELQKSGLGEVNDNNPRALEMIGEKGTAMGGLGTLCTVTVGKPPVLLMSEISPAPGVLATR